MSCQGGESLAWLQLWGASAKLRFVGEVCLAQNIWGQESQGGCILREVGVAEVRTPKKGIKRSSEEGKG